MDFTPNLLRRLERYFGLGAIFFSIAASLYFAYGIFSGLSGTLYTVQNDISYAGAGGSPFLMEAAVILIPVVLFLAYYIIETLGNKYDKYGIARVFAILISSNIILTFILPFLIAPPAVPNVFLTTPFATVMVLLYQYSFQYVLLFLAPILVVSLLYLFSRGTHSVKNLIYGIIPQDVPALGLSTLAWIPVSVLFGLYFFTNGGDVFSFILYATEFFVLSYSFIRFGLPSATILYFSLTSINIVSAWRSELSSSIGSTASLSIGAFVLVWAFVGISSIFAAIFTFIKGGGAIRIRKSTARMMQIGTVRNSISPWINSSCPSCGSVTFKINRDGSLTCLKCSHVIDKDAEGPMNVRIDVRSSRF